MINRSTNAHFSSTPLLLYSVCYRAFLIQIIMVTKEFKFKNGDEVVEKITGFKGTITGTCFYLTGCNQYLITAKCEKEGKEPVALWYDEGRLEYIQTTITGEDVKGIDNGCDIPPLIGMRGA